MGMILPDRRALGYAFSSDVRPLTLDAVSESTAESSASRSSTGRRQRTRRGLPRRPGSPPWRSPPRRCAAPAAGGRCGRRWAAEGRSRAHRSSARARGAAGGRGPVSTRATRPRAPRATSRACRAPARGRCGGAGRARRGPRGRPSSPSAARSACASARAGLGRTTFAPRWAYSSGMIQAWATQASATAGDSGSSASRSAAVPRNGTTCATVVRVQIAPSRSSRAASTRRRQWTSASSGSSSTATAVGRRVSRRRLAGAGSRARRRRAAPPHLLGLPGACRDHPEVAAIELGAEGRDRRLDRLGVVGRPAPASCGRCGPCGSVWTWWMARHTPRRSRTIRVTSPASARASRA